MKRGEKQTIIETAITEAMQDYLGIYDFQLFDFELAHNVELLNIYRNVMAFCFEHGKNRNIVGLSDMAEKITKLLLETINVQAVTIPYVEPTLVGAGASADWQQEGF